MGQSKQVWKTTVHCHKALELMIISTMCNYDKNKAFKRAKAII